MGKQTSDHMHPYSAELNFTEVYKKHANSHIAIREAECIKTMANTFKDIQPGDLFAGRTRYGIFGFGCEEHTGSAGGYDFAVRSTEKIEALQSSSLDPDYIKQVMDAVNYWKKESTNAKLDASLPEDLKKDVSNAFASGFSRMAGLYLDYKKLMKLGLSGLFKLAKEKRGTNGFYDGMFIALGHLINVCLMYAEQARSLPDRAIMAEVLENITKRPPQNFREAIQLAWLYSLISGVSNYGRMDMYLGDFYANDIDSGTLTEEEALELIKSLWQLIADRKIEANGRIIIGGKGRGINEANADRFALAAMEATRHIVETEPQLTLRFYEGMNPLLYEKALDVISEGRVYPILYNDDVNIPAVKNAFEVNETDAEQYLPLGCGEYTISGKSLDSPNDFLNTLGILHAVVHSGKEFETFDDLFNEYQSLVNYSIQKLAQRRVVEYQFLRETCCFIYAAILFGDCVEKGVGLLDGANYLGGTIESIGVVNTGDSLAVIKKLVFDQKRFTLAELANILNANFEGYETERHMIFGVPKYGNDDAETDDIVAMVSYEMNVGALKAGKEAGLHHFLAVNINNRSHIDVGYGTAATADGRKAGEPFANGNTPTAGADKNGITAFLNSILKVDPMVHAGYVHNIKLSRSSMTTYRRPIEALLKSYFQRGGQQAMITVTNRGDLEDALKNPQKHQNLIVRVGGFSSRFVTLDKDLQRDILNRTMY